MIRAAAPSPLRAFSPHPMRRAPSSTHPFRSPTRLAALGILSVALGAGGALISVSYVQAFDESGIRQFHMDEARRYEAARSVARPAPQPGAYYAPSPYAPSRTLALPFFRTTQDGRLAAPAVQLNPFAKAEHGNSQKRQQAKKSSRTAHLPVLTVSGAASAPRSICVRLCDGFHAPIGYLTSHSDLKAHEILCKAMNPGVPVKVFRVAAGASTIDDAIGPDGKSYSSLPMAYAHEKSADPACRPPIVKADERRVSILKDFTLRPGDAVVVNGTARIFMGATNYPFHASDFRDFRSSTRLSETERRKMDLAIGHSFKLASEREARRASQLQEASLSLPGRTAIDIPLGLRGSYANFNDSNYYAEGPRGRIRVIAPGLFGTAR